LILGSRTFCPLCASDTVTFYHKDRFREYMCCSNCRLIFVPSSYHLSKEEEKAEYDLHENLPSDSGYRRFLGRLFEPVAARLSLGSSGLDFGCGPGPALSHMFEEAGYDMSLYDKFYYPDRSVLQKTYDFITSTEVLEHISDPSEVLPRLWALLKPGSVLGIMTKLVRSPEAFASWHYKNDKTHICFYSKETFKWLASTLEAQTEFIGSDVIILTKIRV